MTEDAEVEGPRGPAGEIPLAEIPLHSTNLLTVLDREGVVRYESPAIEYILGFEPDALVGNPVADYFHPEDRERVLDAFGRIVESDEHTVEAVEYRHERANGSYLWVESVASSNPTPTGHYVVNTRDVSDRRTRERALERTNERLDEFAAVVSHDLRNPLNVAAGRLALAREEVESDHLEAVAAAHDRMDQLIEDVLAFARAGEMVGELEPVRLPRLVRDCWANVETETARLDVETDRTVPADESRFSQLLENLLRNAVEHGGEDVTVTVGDLPDGFFLQDTGPGIPESERKAVFEAGYSAHDGGSGLGLSIVQDVAEAHGWVVEVTESPAGGVRLEFTGVDDAR